MQTYASSIASLYDLELYKLKTEILAYKNEQNLWITADGISNSAGNLCLHLVGNVSHFIGAVLGNTGYVRQRDLEFSMKDMSASELAAAIDGVISTVNKVLPALTTEQLKQAYPVKILNEGDSTEHILTYMLIHFGYHLGQINYHRRLLDR